MIYHVSHERNVFRERGIASDAKVAHALPKIEADRKAAEGQLAHGRDDLLGAERTRADFSAFKVASQAKMMDPRFPALSRWRERMERLPAVRSSASRCRCARPSNMRANWRSRILQNIPRSQ